MDVNFRDVVQNIDKLKGGKVSGKPKDPAAKSEASEKKERKVITTRMEDVMPVLGNKVETGAGADTKKSKKGKISYI